MSEESTTTPSLSSHAVGKDCLSDGAPVEKGGDMENEKEEIGNPVVESSNNEVESAMNGNPVVSPSAGDTKDGEGKELFDTFMEIANKNTELSCADNQNNIESSKQNGDDSVKRNESETSPGKLDVNQSQPLKVLPKTDDNTTSELKVENNIESHSMADVKDEQLQEQKSNDNSQDGNSEKQESLKKRLSSAVESLSDLEKQLSCMVEASDMESQKCLPGKDTGKELDGQTGETKELVKSASLEKENENSHEVVSSENDSQEANDSCNVLLDKNLDNAKNVSKVENELADESNVSSPRKADGIETDGSAKSDDSTITTDTENSDSKAEKSESVEMTTKEDTTTKEVVDGQNSEGTEKTLIQEINRSTPEGTGEEIQVKDNAVVIEEDNVESCEDSNVSKTASENGLSIEGTPNQSSDMSGKVEGENAEDKTGILDEKSFISASEVKAESGDISSDGIGEETNKGTDVEKVVGINQDKGKSGDIEISAELNRQAEEVDQSSETYAAVDRSMPDGETEKTEVCAVVEGEGKRLEEVSGINQSSDVVAQSSLGNEQKGESAMSLEEEPIKVSQEESPKVKGESLKVLEEGSLKVSEGEFQKESVEESTKVSEGESTKELKGASSDGESTKLSVGKSTEVSEEESSKVSEEESSKVSEGEFPKVSEGELQKESVEESTKVSEAESPKKLKGESLEGESTKLSVEKSTEVSEEESSKGSEGESTKLQEGESPKVPEESPKGTEEESTKVSEGESTEVSEGESQKAPDEESAAIPDILTTDESGKCKSVESLDTLDDLNCSRSDASDIDSDAISDAGEEDSPFEEGGNGYRNKFLEVGRNRYGSNSSTLSEREFKESGSFTAESSVGKDIISGFLLKLGGTGLTPRNWRKRWFVLKEDNCLYYYKTSKDHIPCGVIVLLNYSISKAPDSSKRHCFKLNKGGARSYNLSAHSDADMKAWMMALMQAAANVSAPGACFQILEGNVHNVSIPALSIRDPDCHGYLSKQGHKVKSWRRRYCVLKNGYLYYYSDMANTTALGVAKLIGYTLQADDVKGKHYSFYANAPDASLRTYRFAAETETDRKRWMSKMEDSIKRGTH